MHIDTQTILLAIIVIAGFGIAIVLALSNQMDLAHLRQQGAHVQGEITSLDYESGQNSSRSRVFTPKRDYNRSREDYLKGKGQNTGEHFYARYKYVVNGRTFHKREKISEGAYRHLFRGSPVDVVYLPKNPRIACLAQDL